MDKHLRLLSCLLLMSHINTYSKMKCTRHYGFSLSFIFIFVEFHTLTPAEYFNLNIIKYLFFFLVCFYVFSFCICLIIKFLSRIYESAPWSMEAWSRPVENSPLASTRLAGTANNASFNSNSVRQ